MSVGHSHSLPYQVYSKERTPRKIKKKKTEEETKKIKLMFSVTRKSSARGLFLLLWAVI